MAYIEIHASITLLAQVLWVTIDHFVWILLYSLQNHVSACKQIIVTGNEIFVNLDYSWGGWGGGERARNSPWIEWAERMLDSN